MKQTVGHKKLGTIRGLLLVLALVVVLILLNYVLLRYIAMWLGNTAASITFWVVGGLIALWILRTYIVVYTYEISGNVLRICRKYGKRERFIDDIYLNRITFLGSPEEAKRRNPKAKIVRAVHSAVKDEKSGMIYNTADGPSILIFQPDAEMKAKLVSIIRKK